MNPFLWFLVLQEFGALQTSLDVCSGDKNSPPHNHRLWGLCHFGSPHRPWSRGKAPVGVQKLKLFGHLLIIF